MWRQVVIKMQRLLPSLLMSDVETLPVQFQDEKYTNWARKISCIKSSH